MTDQKKPKRISDEDLEAVQGGVKMADKNADSFCDGLLPTSAKGYLLSGTIGGNTVISDKQKKS